MTMFSIDLAANSKSYFDTGSDGRLLILCAFATLSFVHFLTHNSKQPAHLTTHYVSLKSSNFFEIWFTIKIKIVKTHWKLVCCGPACKNQLWRQLQVAPRHWKKTLNDSRRATQRHPPCLEKKCTTSVVPKANPIAPKVF